MVHCCCVPGCSSRSDRERHLSFFGLPLKNKSVLRQWVHLIGRKNLPINSHTRICSSHFIQATGRLLRPDEVPSQNLPVLTTSASMLTPRRPPRERPFESVSLRTDSEDHDGTNETPSVRDAYTQVGESAINGEGELAMKVEKIELLRTKISELEQLKFRLSNIKNDDIKVSFYTGFTSYGILDALFTFLGPSVESLSYSKFESENQRGNSKRCRPRTLPPLEEFFLTLVRLRLGLMEQDLAYRFGISQSTVSRITTTWINLLYLKLKEIPLWMPKGLVHATMPQQFKKQYPTTRVIVDATEIYVEQPKLPELQQMTFSNYKNDNTYKGLVGISPNGVITFISSLYPGSISDKELTRRCGILDLLEPGDSVMADRGFDIEEDLALHGVRLNIPPFLRGKGQLSQKELITTRRIASLRIHVERAMERIKNFHIFDRSIPASLTDIADRIFFVCCVLANFQPPLCS